MELFKRTKRKLVITGVTAVLFCGAFALVVYYFTTVMSEVGDLETKVEQAKQDEEQLVLVKKTLQDVEGNKDLLDALFITADNEADFVKSIEGLASSTNVSLDITSLRHDPGPAKTRFEYVAMQGNVEGSIEQVYHFMHLLGRFGKALEIKQLQFEVMPNDTKKKENKWRGTFGVRSLKIK
jgi:hypothetical protein